MTELLKQRVHVLGTDGKRQTLSITPTRGDLKRAAMAVDPTMRDPEARAAAKAADEYPEDEARCPECGQVIE